MTEEKKDEQGAVAGKVSAALEGAFDAVASGRRAYFVEHPKERPTKADIKEIISNYANKNFVISGAASLVPGPWGAAVILPELIAVLRNQVQMIYDLGVAHGKEQHMNPRLLLAVFAITTGGGAITLATVKGGQLLVRRASLRVVQRIIVWLGGKITQKALKAFFAKWVPLVGAAAMAAWARQTTMAMGKKAAELLEKEIVEIDEEAEAE